MRRRDLLKAMALTSGGVVLGANLLGSRVLASAAAAPAWPVFDGLHFAPRARRVLFLWLAGGISPHESFENKAILERLHDTSPARYKAQCSVGCLKPLYPFARHGQSGIEVSDRFPHLAKVIDELTVVKTLQNFAPAHPQANNFLFTGERLNDMPSLGAWVNYAIGSDNPSLPGFVALGGDSNISNGFLPSDLHGVFFNTEGHAIDFLERPAGVSAAAQRRAVEQVARLDRLYAQRQADAHGLAHANVFELADRMQSSIPAVLDLGQEPESMRAAYGLDQEATRKVGTNLLAARRLLEQGVRFVRVADEGWDHHTGLETGFPKKSLGVDQPLAALLADLKQRGMLDDTLVVVAGEFGRTPFNEGKIIGGFGRGHNPDAGIILLAGAGIRRGHVHGETDEFGFQSVKDPVNVNDLNATILYALGLDHLRLTFEQGGRTFRPTGVGECRIVRELFA
jgi:hypothetical protein